VVEDVEEIGASLEREALIKLELPAQRQIDLCRAEAAQGIRCAASGRGRPVKSIAKNPSSSALASAGKSVHSSFHEAA